MSKEYVFEFNGTKEEFIKKLDFYPNNSSYNGNKFYYFNDFIVKIIDNNAIHFGVERGGHSSGYWFIPSITEYENRIEFRGTVIYIGSEDNHGKIQKFIDCIEIVLLYILILPIVVIIRICQVVAWVVRKLLKREKQMPKTTEEKLFDLMINHLGCKRKETK